MGLKRNQASVAAAPRGGGAASDRASKCQLRVVGDLAGQEAERTAAGVCRAMPDLRLMLGFSRAVFAPSSS